MRPNPDQKKDITQPSYPDTPEPERDSDSSGEYKFNLGLFRIDTINDILTVCAKRYHKAFEKKDQRNVRKYQAIINTLYTEVYIYMEDETKLVENLDIQTDSVEKRDVLKQTLDKKIEIDNEDEALEEIRKIRNIYLSLRKMLKDAGLDIPVEERIGETDIL